MILPRYFRISMFQDWHLIGIPHRTCVRSGPGVRARVTGHWRMPAIRFLSPNLYADNPISGIVRASKRLVTLVGVASDNRRFRRRTVPYSRRPSVGWGPLPR